MQKLKYLVLVIILISSVLPSVIAEEDSVCSVYLTGVGCPHCAKADPVVLEKLTSEYQEFVVIEYEIYQQQENAQILYEYDNTYNSGLGIPQIIFNEDESIKGDSPIIENAENIIKEKTSNSCPLKDGSSKSFEEIDLSELPGKPKIWKGEKVLVKKSSSINSDVLKELILSEDPSEIIGGISATSVTPEPVPLSGKEVNFENAIQVDGWLFQWNGEGVNVSDGSTVVDPSENGAGSNLEEKELTFAKILSLAAVDAVNPCAIAVLTLMLIAILTYNPEKKKNVLLAGLAFISSVFIMYLIYGLFIIKSFQLVQALTSVRVLLYKILGIVALILGALNIKDYFHYKPGGIFTEMPMFLRPKMKKVVSQITSPKGAFVVGLFVTVFLLPCTIGPYVIAGGILSSIELMKTLPFLLLYNLVFVLPMAAITLMVYKGFAKVDDVGGWKDKNIKYLHLVAGIIMALLGIAMFMGWV